MVVENITYILAIAREMGFGIIWSKEIRLEGRMAASQHPMGVGGG